LILGPTVAAGDTPSMARKLHPLVKFDKDVAEKLLGHSPGRPTISRRAGRQLGDALGVSDDAGTDLFHVGLVAVAAAVFFKSGK